MVPNPKRNHHNTANQQQNQYPTFSLFSIGRSGAAAAVVPIKSKRLGSVAQTASISPKAAIPDARNKIIQRNRSKIADARDKLAEITKQSGDVRQKLLRKQQQQASGGGRKPIGAAGLISASASARSAAAAASTRRGSRVNQQPQQHIAIDDADLMDVDFVPAEYALRRTVHNDMAHHNKPMPPLPHFAVRADRAAARAGAHDPYHSYHQQQQHQQLHHQHHHHHHPHRLVRPQSPPPLPQSSLSPPLPRHHHHQQPHHQLHHAASGGGPAGAWSSPIDPFDCYVVPMQRPHDVSEPKHLQRQIRGGGAGAHPDLIPTKGILRYSSSSSSARASSPPLPQMKSAHNAGGYDSDPRYHHHHGAAHHHGSASAAHLSYEMRTRLERAPDSSASAGSFSNPYSLQNNSSSSRSDSSSKPKLIVSTESSRSIEQGSDRDRERERSSASSSSSANGYRIVISNLHSSVSQSDIRELFEDIGELVDARLVRPGVSEVIFRTMKDAELAVDTYHNRQLDGQPMKCLLVHPRAASRPTAPAMMGSRR